MDWHLTQGVVVVLLYNYSHIMLWKLVRELHHHPNSDESEISLYIITTCSNIQVMRIKEVITEDKVS